MKKKVAAPERQVRVQPKNKKIVITVNQAIDSEGIKRKILFDLQKLSFD